MGTTPEDKDKQKRPYHLLRNDAERLAEDKRIAEARERAEKDARAAQERFGKQRQQKDVDLNKDLDLKKTLTNKQLQDKKRVQDEILMQELTYILYSPVIMQKPKPGPKHYPKPPAIQEYIDELEDPDLNESVYFDESTGILSFSGPKGLDALEKYLEKNIDAKFGLKCGHDGLKSHLHELRKRGLLHKLDSIEVDGKLLQGNDLTHQIQKSINWPPKPTPSSGT